MAKVLPACPTPTTNPKTRIAGKMENGGEEGGGTAVACTIPKNYTTATAFTLLGNCHGIRLQSIKFRENDDTAIVVSSGNHIVTLFTNASIGSFRTSSAKSTCIFPILPTPRPIFSKILTEAEFFSLSYSTIFTLHSDLLSNEINAVSPTSIISVVRFE